MAVGQRVLRLTSGVTWYREGGIEQRRRQRVMLRPFC
jgi:hypothetical protein